MVGHLFIQHVLGYIEIVKLLLEDYRIDVNKADNIGYTPFYIACQEGHIEIVKLLLEDYRIDVTKADEYWWYTF